MLNQDIPFDELYLLYKEIDTLMDKAGYEGEEDALSTVRDRIRGLAISLGVHAEFLAEYTQLAQTNGLILTVRH